MTIGAFFAQEAVFDDEVILSRNAIDGRKEQKNYNSEYYRQKILLLQVKMLEISYFSFILSWKKHFLL